MKVLHLHSGNLYGGVETFLVTLAQCRHLVPSMEMSVALCFEGRVADKLRAEGAPTTLLGAVRLRRPDTVWRARRALTALLRESRVDVVVCHQAWPLVIFGKPVRAAGVPLVLWVHTVGTGRHWLDWWVQHVPPDLIVCSGQFTRRTIAARYPAARTDWIRYPVIDHEADVTPEARARDRRGARAEFATPADDLVIIQVSRLEALKGQDVCLEALAQLRDVPGWTCWQVGGIQRPEESRYLARLRSIAEDSGIADRVRFLGERADVPRLLRAADIYCQPNTAPEAFPIALLEALSARLPIVTTSIGGAPEIVDDTCGMLVQPRAARALAAALRRLLTDADLRRHLASQTRARRVELCDPQRQIDRIERLLRTASRRQTAAMS